MFKLNNNKTENIFTIIDSSGNKYYYKSSSYSEPFLHNEDGPAIEYANGDKEYYLNGKLHREDGPAKEFINGFKLWCINGKFHREDGPAIEHVNGNKEWYFYDTLHREDGPAIEYADGTYYWCHKGIIHRIDGPAVYIPNIRKEWRINSNLHREDGPAVEYANGDCDYLINNLFHREDGPAIIRETHEEYWEYGNFIKFNLFKDKKIYRKFTNHTHEVLLKDIIYIIKNDNKKKLYSLYNKFDFEKTISNYLEIEQKDILLSEIRLAINNRYELYQCESCMQENVVYYLSNTIDMIGCEDYILDNVL